MRPSYLWRQAGGSAEDKWSASIGPVTLVVTLDPYTGRYKPYVSTSESNLSEQDDLESARHVAELKAQELVEKWSAQLREVVAAPIAMKPKVELGTITYYVPEPPEPKRKSRRVAVDHGAPQPGLRVGVTYTDEYQVRHTGLTAIARRGVSVFDERGLEIDGYRSVYSYDAAACCAAVREAVWELWHRLRKETHPVIELATLETATTYIEARGLRTQVLLDAEVAEVQS